MAEKPEQSTCAEIDRLLVAAGGGAGIQLTIAEGLHSLVQFLKVQHYWLEVNAVAQPMRVEEERADYHGNSR